MKSDTFSGMVATCNHCRNGELQITGFTTVRLGGTEVSLSAPSPARGRADGGAQKEQEYCKSQLFFEILFFWLCN